MKMNFKVGDRVKVVKSEGYLSSEVLHEIGTVKYVNSAATRIGLLLDKGANPRSQFGVYWFHEPSLEKVSEDPVNDIITDYIRYDIDSTNQTAKKRLNKLYGTPSIKNVIFHDPATIVFWTDGTKTVVKRGPRDSYDNEKGLAMAIAKKALGNEGNYYNTFKKWLPDEEPNNITVTIDAAQLSNDIRKMLGLGTNESKKIERMCRSCVHNMESGSKCWCACSQPCINGDEWKPKK